MVRYFNSLMTGTKYCRTLRGLPLVSSADGERGAPPMVAGLLGHTLMDSSYAHTYVHSNLTTAVA